MAAPVVLVEIKADDLHMLITKGKVMAEIMKRPWVRTGIHDVPPRTGNENASDLVRFDNEIDEYFVGVVWSGFYGYEWHTNGYECVRTAMHGYDVLRIVRLYYGRCNYTTDGGIILPMKWKLMTSFCL